MLTRTKFSAILAGYIAPDNRLVHRKVGLSGAFTFGPRACG